MSLEFLVTLLLLVITFFTFSSTAMFYLLYLELINSKVKDKAFMDRYTVSLAVLFFGSLILLAGSCFLYGAFGINLGSH